MSKKKERKPALDRMAWITKLPDAGGAWGNGALQQVNALETEATKFDREADEYEVAAKEARTKANDRRSLADQTARRAEREAPKLYSAEQIKAATAAAGLVPEVPEAASQASA